MVLFLSIFAWAPATYPGYWQALEGFTPIFNVAQPGRLASIAVAPDLWRGSGRATFLLTQPMLLLGTDAVTAVRVSFIICFLLGGLGTYIWLQTRLGDRPASLAGLLYMMAPPFLATVYIRGSLSDALVLGLLPVALAGISTYAQTGALSAAGIVVVVLGWLWQTQAGLAVFCSLFLLGYALVVERQWMTVLVVLLSSAAALATIFPLFGMQATSPVQFEEHFVAFFQLFRPIWGVAPSVPGWQDQYPFQLSMVALLCSGAGLWLWLFKGAQALPAVIRRLFWFSLVGALLFGWLSLASSTALWQSSGAARLLTYPWQLLLLTTPLLAVTAALLPTLFPALQQPPHWAILLLVAVMGSYPYLTTTFTRYQPPAAPVAVLGQQELIVLSATLTEDRQQQKATLAVTWQPIQPLSADYNVFLQALAEEGTMLRVAAQLDVQPLGAERPPTTWRPGEILTNTYQLDLTGIAPAVDLQYHFGYYDWRDGARLLVDGGIDDKLVFYGD
ncbi:MAG: hypothetical protein KF832_23545 [Caldilineaceae bacterium]|nr:hypothetical protein [Caldilineaceae bacterium]